MPVFVMVMPLCYELLLALFLYLHAASNTTIADPDTVPQVFALAFSCPGLALKRRPAGCGRVSSERLGYEMLGGLDAQ